jgi:hypothetical protein
VERSRDVGGPVLPLPQGVHQLQGIATVQLLLERLRRDQSHVHPSSRSEVLLRGATFDTCRPETSYATLRWGCCGHLSAGRTARSGSWRLPPGSGGDPPIYFRYPAQCGGEPPYSWIR